MSQDQSPVLTFPLPAIAGGGNGSLRVQASQKAGHVDLTLRAGFLGSVVTLPAEDVEPFARHMAAVAAMSRHFLAGRK